MHRSIVAEKLASLGLAAAIVGCLPVFPAQKIAFVLGHAHILAAWLYFYLAGKMTRTFLLQFGLLTTALFGSYQLMPWYRTLVLVTPLFFLAHLLLDEIYLLQTPINLRRSPMHMGRFLELATFFVLCGGQILQSLGFPGSLPNSLALAAALALGYVILWARGLHRPDPGSAYFWSANLLFLALILAPLRFNYVALMSFLILFHVFDWYFHFYLQLPPGSPARPQYLRRAGGLIGLSGLLYAAGHFHFWEAAASLYEETTYDLWSLVHLTFSLRLNDVKALIKTSQEG
ncbi:MAG: hypothetical protein J0I12_11945 [Candidatus Eremiobacteraeota bacterium]|nr:hypothetical protein [Candidatus Eremiobacteraeota bacterium]